MVNFVVHVSCDSKVWDFCGIYMIYMSRISRIDSSRVTFAGISFFKIKQNS